MMFLDFKSVRCLSTVILKDKNDPASIKKRKHIEEELADKYAESNRKYIQEEIDGIKCEEGGINSGKLWKLKKKLCPKLRDPQTAMLD